MNATDPTYYLYAGRLFHESALPALSAQRVDDSTEGPASRRGGSSRTTQPRRGEDPSPEGPEGEPVGDEDDNEADDEDAEGEKGSRPDAKLILDDTRGS